MDVDGQIEGPLYQAGRAAGGSSRRAGRVSCCWWARGGGVRRGRSRDGDGGASGNKVGRSLRGGQCRPGEGLRA